MSKRKSPDLTMPRWSFCKYLIWSVVKWTYNFEEGWSLDVCVGRTLESGKFRWDQIVCPKTLCNYVDNGLIRTKNIELAEKLKRSTKKKIVRKNKRILGDSAGCKGIIWYFVLLATARWHFKVPSGGCYLPGKMTCNSESLCYNHFHLWEGEGSPPGWRICLTYTVAPYWCWIGRLRAEEKTAAPTGGSKTGSE